jgi:N-acetylmuramic acid 6-phosphate etherase
MFGRAPTKRTTLTPVTRHELDLLPSGAIVELLLDAEERVVPAVRAVAGDIAMAADAVADCMRRGGRIAFVGAGTSGRLAMVEAAELPGTFGLRDADVMARVAGVGARSQTGTDRDEDDVEAALGDIDSMRLGHRDVLIAVAASGRTPYTVAAARHAKGVGCCVIAVVNLPDSPLAHVANVTIEVTLGPEVLRGSTRLTAGTAQKLVLNALTTAAMVRLGRVHGDVMVDVVAANGKLRDRVVDIVVEISGSTRALALTALVECDWNARAAILRLTAGLAAPEAADVAGAHASLRDAMDAQQL